MLSPNNVFSSPLAAVNVLLLVALLVSPLPANAAPAPAVAPAAATAAALLAGPSRAPTAAERAGIITSLQQMPMYFVENQGQTDERVAYYLKGGDTTVFFGQDGLTFAIDGVDLDNHDTGLPGPETGRYVLKLEFVGAAPVRPLGEMRDEATVSYFRGDPEEWRTGLPTYGRIAYHNLWPGIDLAYHGSEGGLKYEFIVQPGADPSQICLAYHGATGLELEETGALSVATPVRELSDQAPLAYQLVDGERQVVEAAYAPVAEASACGFGLGSYDAAAVLVIDPELVYCGYIGGSDGGVVGTEPMVSGAGSRKRQKAVRSQTPPQLFTSADAHTLSPGDTCMLKPNGNSCDSGPGKPKSPTSPLAASGHATWRVSPVVAL